MTERAQEIRSDLESLRQKQWLAGPDYMLDWMSEELEKDEISGILQWDAPKKPRKKRVKAE